MAPDPYKYFRPEARELLDQFAQGVLELEKGEASAAAVQRLLRLAHTLKGAARVVKQSEIAERALDRLDVAKRATFVMFEIESLSCLEISELMNVPIGTVYSRLHGARRQLEKTIARDLKRRQLGMKR